MRKQCIANHTSNHVFLWKKLLGYGLVSHAMNEDYFPLFDFMF